MVANSDESPRTYDQHWLIWDGQCGFCRRVVVWFQQQDNRRAFRIIPMQSCPSPPMTPKLYAESQKAMQVITRDGKQISGGRSVLYVLETMGWHPLMMRIASNPPFVWAIDVGYKIVARNRTLVSRLLFGGRGADGPTC